MRVLISATICLAVLGAASSARAQSAENVAVVINELDAASVRVGEHYVQTRKIPSSNVIRIKTTSDDVIEREAFVSTIENPIAAALLLAQLQDRVLYLVLTKGLPLRIAGTAGRDGTSASVDSELTLLYRRMTGRSVATRGLVGNPYFLGSRDIADAKPFTHREHDVYLVSRLDAFTVEEAIALIDRAQAPVTSGKIVLDIRDISRGTQGDKWLGAAATQLSADGQSDRVVLEQTSMPARDISPVLGYYGWGSTDRQNQVRKLGLGFSPGAIAATFVNTDARTFKEPPTGWQPTGIPADRNSMFRGSPHSLIGDLIREGVTGVAGQVSEPFFEGVVRPDILFRAYLAGRNLIESYYLALPQLGWQTVIVGDPLCAPFAGTPSPGGDFDPAIDEGTTLPTFFSARRVEAFAESQPGLPKEIVTLWVRSRAALVRGDRDLARGALEEAIKKAPLQVDLRVDLATMYDQDGNVDEAIAQYERAVELQPNNFIALNNLAYALAVHRQKPADAVTFATRAATLAPDNADVLDTLAWIEHLLGDNASAARRFDEAVRRKPRDASIRVRAAVVLVELGRRARAEAELKEALLLNPGLDDTEQVKQLKVKLAPLPK